MKQDLNAVAGMAEHFPRELSLLLLKNLRTVIQNHSASATTVKGLEARMLAELSDTEKHLRAAMPKVAKNFDRITREIEKEEANEC